MLILLDEQLLRLDEQLPRQLAAHLSGHEVRTVHQQGWDGLKNGLLLRTAEAGNFQDFLTSDQNLEFQLNLKKSGLFIVVLVAFTNKLEDLLPLVLAALNGFAPGKLIRVGEKKRP